MLTRHPNFNMRNRLTVWEIASFRKLLMATLIPRMREERKGNTQREEKGKGTQYQEGGKEGEVLQRGIGNVGNGERPYAYRSGTKNVRKPFSSVLG